MADKTTFVKLDRNILQWRWFKNSKILHVFLWLLLKANVKDGHFEKEIVKRGSLATSNESIAEGCGLTINNVRTALSNLEDTEEISRTIRNHYQIITVRNYELYQSALSKLGGQLTGNLDGNSQATSRSTHNNQRIIEGKKERRYKGRSAPGSPSGRNDAHLRLGPDEGTVDDIPDIYRDMFDNFADYWRWRNQ